jgi:competence protein ComEC
MLTGKILALLLGLLYKSVAVTGILPGSLIENIYLSSAGAIILALLIITAALYLLSRRRILIMTCLFLILVFLAMGTVHQYSMRRQDMILIGNMRDLSIAQVIRGKHGIIFCSDLKQTDESSMNYHFANFWIKAGIAGQNHIMADTGKKYGYQNSWLGRNKLFKTGAGSVMILYEDISAVNSGNPVTVDLLVITNGVTPDINRILDLINPRMVVVDSSVRPSRRRYWRQSCKEKNVKCHVIFEEGAFLLAAG